MKDGQKFFYCKHCHNLVGMLYQSGVPIICCGEPMTELTANTTEAALEKHVPEITIEGSTIQVQVGSVAHPMAEEHHIAWIYLQTDCGGQRKALKVGESPKATFALAAQEHPLAVFAYCNLHSLWKKEL